MILSQRTTFKARRMNLFIWTKINYASFLRYLHFHVLMVPSSRCTKEILTQFLVMHYGSVGLVTALASKSMAYFKLSLVVPGIYDPIKIFSWVWQHTSYIFRLMLKELDIRASNESDGFNICRLIIIPTYLTIDIFLQYWNQ